MLSREKSIFLAVPVAVLVAGLWFIGSNQETSGEAGGDAAGGGSPAATVVADAGAASGDFTAGQTKAIESIVRKYLVANPEIFLEIQSALETKMEKEQSERLKVAIREHKDELFRREGAPVVGDEEGDITVVEFFDYNCGYCKQGFDDVAKLIENDKNVRVVFKEMPILSKGSEDASRVALAARKQGKYWEVHQALLKNKGQTNKASALRIAEKLGLDRAQLEADMNSPEVTAEIEDVRALAQKMGIGGTPYFLVGDRSIPGAPSDLYDVLVKHVAELRKGGCEVC